MKPKIFSGYLSSAFYAALLSVAIPLSAAEEAKNVEIHLSAVELQEIFNNPKRSYIYVGPEASDIAKIIAEVAQYDEDPASLVHGLDEHAKKGFNIGNYDAVAQALEQAQQVVANNADVLGEEKTDELTNSLNSVIDQVIEDKLSLDSDLLSFLKDSVMQEDVTKSGCCKPKPHCHGLRLLVVKEKVDFQGKVKFREDVTFKDDVTFQDSVIFEDPATFEDNVAIAGTLSVTDLAVLSCVDSLCVNTLSVTDLAVLSCVDSLCVNTLSVTDFIISGGSCVDSFCIGLLSVADGSITGTLLVNDLVVASISVADGSITGTLSVNDLVVNSIDDLCDITVGCNINMVNSVDAAHGNVLKAGTPFIHNFGTNNTFVGVNAGNFTTSLVGGNTAVGENTLAVNTTGETSTAVGYNALAAHTNGISNVAIGAFALAATTTSSFNLGLGSNALLNNITGTRNVGLGDSTLRQNISGNNNIAVGKNSLFISTGSNNTSVGDNAGVAVTTGSSNIIIGQNAAPTLTTGSTNIYINADAAVAAESNTTRIGTLGSQTRCFMQGISGVATVGAAIPVLVAATGQLGTISSSRDVKHDIADMGSASNNVMDLRPVTFVYNDDFTNETRYGLIAEEVDQVFPALAVKDMDGKVYSVHYETLPVLLLNELQKLAARVAVLEGMQQ